MGNWALVSACALSFTLIRSGAKRGRGLAVVDVEAARRQAKTPMKISIIMCRLNIIYSLSVIFILITCCEKIKILASKKILFLTSASDNPA